MVFSGIAGVFFAACVAVTLWWFARKRPAPVPIVNDTPRDIVLLFRNGVLTDAHDSIWELLGPDRAEDATWDTVRAVLSRFVPDVPHDVPTTSGQVAHSRGPKVACHVTGAMVRLTVIAPPNAAASWFNDLQVATRLAQLEPAIAFSPNPIWCLDRKGKVLWSNKAFDRMTKVPSDPNDFAKHVTQLMSDPIAPMAKRMALGPEKAKQPRWFEVTIQETDFGVLHFATNVDAVVQAEDAQRNFVQTLSKTFANLTTGLAIFDRNRRLVLFNPALIDLSGLSAEFLTGRPNLFDFFDKLRDKQIMPEPKNYDNWRECMAKMVAAASDDRFRETWNLAGGQTFDVTGRPYPDGAIAFLFNDITAEVTLTRGFRAELETMQSSLDAMDDAIAVFSRKGTLTLCNDAYKAMWKVDPDTCIEGSTIMASTLEWKSAFHPDPIWPELREFVTTTQERASWDADLRAKDGREVICRVDPICYGSTLVRFSYAAARRSPAADPDPLQIVSA